MPIFLANCYGILCQILKKLELYTFCCYRLNRALFAIISRIIGDSFWDHELGYSLIDSGFYTTLYVKL
jgi:hypothetical protein